MPKPDWEAIESAYRAGDLSLREIAAQNGISEGSIRKRAKKNEWVRNANAGTQKSTHCVPEVTQHRGRPSDYKIEYSDLAKRLCMLDLTDSELAAAMDVSEQTINTWKKKYPAFLESIKKGKLIADADVAAKLFHRATGYEHPEDDIRAVDGRIVITPTTKHYPPDTAAAIFWLKNRQRDKWRDKQEVEHTGELNLVDRIQAARKRARGEHDK